MLYEIKHRHTGAVLFSLECGSLKLCVEAAIKSRADLGGADLRGADLGGADLGGADLRGADLGGADLGGAYLRGADLGGADLGGAYLRGAYLGGADLGGAIWIDGGSDRRGFSFFTLRTESGELQIRAGCHCWADFATALAHYGETYSSNGDRDECIARLTLMRDELARRMVSAQALEAA